VLGVLRVFKVDNVIERMKHPLALGCVCQLRLKMCVETCNMQGVMGLEMLGEISKT